MWEFLLVEPWSQELRRKDGVYTLGATIPMQHRVYINGKLPEYMMIKVITHELTHVYASAYGIKIDIGVEELLADFISTYGRDILMAADTIMSQVI